MFTSFSLCSNLRRIFSSETRPDDLPVLNGVRVISYVYLVLGLTFFTGTIFTQVWSTGQCNG